MKRKQVFVRAVDETGAWGSADVLDLDDDSFRAFVVGMMFRAGLCVGLDDDVVEGGAVRLRLKPGLRHERKEA